MLIRKLMSPKPSIVAPQDTLGDARLLMERGNFRRLPVVEGERLVGIVTDRDVLRRVGNLDSVKVKAAMTPDPIVVTPEMTVRDAVELMLSHKFSGFPVLENGQVVGMLTTTDVLKAFLLVYPQTQ